MWVRKQEQGKSSCEKKLVGKLDLLKNIDFVLVTPEINVTALWQTFYPLEFRSKSWYQGCFVSPEAKHMIQFTLKFYLRVAAF